MPCTKYTAQDRSALNQQSWHMQHVDGLAKAPGHAPCLTVLSNFAVV